MTVLKDKDTPKTFSEIAYRSIRDDIVYGHLLPGKKLKMVMLKEKYGIGAAPIREALSRLASERLVFQDGQRGFDVIPVTCEDAIDIGRVRTLLELEALQESITLGDDDWEASLVATYHRLRLAEGRYKKAPEDNLRDLEIWNGRFHLALIQAARSRWIMELRSQLYLHHERYRHLSRHLSKGHRDTAMEHEQIFNAAIKRDADLACELTRKHIQNTTDTVVQALCPKNKT